MATAPARARPAVTSMHVFCAVLLVAILARPVLTDAWDVPGLRTVGTVFVAVRVQALPFLVLGVLLSGALSAFVSPALLRRVLPPARRSPYRWPERRGWCCPAASARRPRSPAA